MREEKREQNDRRRGADDEAKARLTGEEKGEGEEEGE